MKITKQYIELLCPAGSFESLEAVIRAGADAIYFGVEQLNMRARSNRSFTIKDISKISASCKASGVKCYITLNTVVFDHDFQLLNKILSEVKKHGIDAVIAADFAVMEQCKRRGIPIHVSTQANVSNIDAVQFFFAYADVIVLARELTLKQVASIVKEIKRRKLKGPSGNLVKIEVFVHGALCMAVSGKCYISLHTQNASANRGACLQHCRRSYLVKDAETGEELLVDNEYIMSPKDLCTIDLLDKIIESGVDILKIEGRNKGADYVYTVTSCYREGITAIDNGEYSPEKISKWKTELSKVYNRGFWEGYYLGRKAGEWTDQPGSIATEKKIYLGKGVRYYPKKKIGEFIIESGTMKAEDNLLIIGPNYGMVRKKGSIILVNGAMSKLAIKGDRVTIPLEDKVTPYDKLYKLVENNYEESSLLS